MTLPTARSHKKKPATVPLTAAQVAEAEAALAAKQAAEAAAKAALDVGEVKASVTIKGWRRGLHISLVIPSDEDD